MSLISTIQYHYFKQFQKLVYTNRQYAVECQQRVLMQLISKARYTEFGKEHHFDRIKTYDDFKKYIPLTEYEAFKPYIHRILNRKQDILWPGLPAYFGKSTGTTDASKYVPLTREFLTCTQYAAKYMLCNLLQQVPGNVIGKKVLYLDSIQPFENINGFECAAISAIKSSRIPRWARAFSFPGDNLNHIIDSEQKLNAIIDTIEGNDIKMAVALPVWLSYFLQSFEAKKGKRFKEVFPGFRTLFLSGMNYEPYEKLVRTHMGAGILILENYTATEGNFAYQPIPGLKAMELISNQGIFYEFIPLERNGDESSERLMLHEVELSKKYALAISSNCGLWAYRVNDIVEFVSLNPYRIIICGRMKNIFSPFGEHLLPIHAEQAIALTAAETNVMLSDFLIVPDHQHCRYICYTAFENTSGKKESFNEILEKNLGIQNSYYYELVRTGVLNKPQIIPVTNAFFAALNQAMNKQTSAQQKSLHLTTDEEIIKQIKALLKFVA